MEFDPIRPHIRQPAFLSLRVIVLVGLVALLLAVMAALAMDVRSRLAALKRADSDNGQWVMMQTEVEVLRLQAALANAIHERTDLSDVRRWYDVLYSRLSLLRESPLYADFIQEHENLIRLERMQDYADRWLSAIDGPDEALWDVLLQMRDENLSLQRDARALSLRALLTFSNYTDDTRKKVTDTLTRLAVTTAATFMLLAVLAVMSMRLYRRIREQAHENQITGDRLHMIIATSPDAIIVTNRGGWLVEFNPAAEAMLGHTRAEVIGKKMVRAFFPAELYDQSQALLNEVIATAATEGPQRFELEAQRADGSRFPVEISIAIRDLNRGSLIVGFLRDVSARKADQQVLEQALTRAQAGEKAKAEFLAVMSHEMRTPLNGLIGALGLLRDTRLSPEQQELLRVMQVSGEILLGHVNSVLDISRIEAGEVRLADSPFDLDRLVEDCIANQAGLARAGGNTIRHNPLDGRLGMVRGDPARLRQILLNLIGNAVKFTRNGTITVETERLPPLRGNTEAPMVEFRVIDTGIGIDEADQDRIFDDFETLDSSYGRETGGTGLGLGIVRRLIRAMRGRIGVESEPGEGSIFWLTLPLPAVTLAPPQDETHAMPAHGPALTGRALPAAGRSESPTAGQPRDILILEDNEINRFLLRRYLEEAGHRVVEACDGQEGVAAARATRFDVIVTDISMPRLDGIGATRQIRAGGASASARIIALTAHALPEDLERFRAAGMDGCLAKPFTREGLLAQISPQTVSPPAQAAGPLPRNVEIVSRARLQELGSSLGTAIMGDLLRRMVLDGNAAAARFDDPTLPLDEAVTVSHKLSGGCATFGAMPLQQVLGAVEQAIRDGEEEEARRLIALASPLWALTRAALQRHAEALAAA